MPGEIVSATGKASMGQGGSKKKTAKKSAVTKRARQGSALPPDGSTLSAYPEGCCVLIAVTARDVRVPGAVMSFRPASIGAIPFGDVHDDVDAAWYLVSFRIGREGSPHCRRLSHPPSSLAWNVGMGLAAETNGYLAVLESRWPERAAPMDDALGVEADPMQIMEQANPQGGGVADAARDGRDGRGGIGS
jgi:hypothetical protein